MNLYCLSKSESSRNDNNTWLFRNVTINQVSHSNHYDIVDRGRVLVIRNVSTETSGVYTCCTASEEEYSAFVDVLGEHNLYLSQWLFSIVIYVFRIKSFLVYSQGVDSFADNIVIGSTTHNFTSDDQIDIDTEALAATNHTISLSCHTQSRLISSDHSNLNFEWFFRGRPLYSSPPSNSGSQNHLAVTFIKRANMLTMIAEDPWLLIGTVQCFVSIAPPTGADQLREVKSANVHILARGRLNIG